MAREEIIDGVWRGMLASVIEIAHLLRTPLGLGSASCLPESMHGGAHVLLSITLGGMSVVSAPAGEDWSQLFANTRGVSMIDT